MLVDTKKCLLTFFFYNKNITLSSKKCGGKIMGRKKALKGGLFFGKDVQYTRKEKEKTK